MYIDKQESIIIAGPCALESEDHLLACIRELKQLGISIMRAPIWKPRTKPDWDGIGPSILEFLFNKALNEGLVPAIEILSPIQALMVINAMEKYGNQTELIVWLGSRNQNHIFQREIAEILATSSDNIFLMFKNQMWEDEQHWLGIYQHLLAGGFPKERLMSCHRGFAPGKNTTTQNYRNIPDFEMAMRVKKHTGIPMLIDPSHIGGSKANVLEICNLALAYEFDGWLIEMHPTPDTAKTDSKQQLSPSDLNLLLKKIKKPIIEKKAA